MSPFPAIFLAISLMAVKSSSFGKKAAFILLLTFFIVNEGFSQKKDSAVLRKVLPKIDTIVPGNGTSKQQIKESKAVKRQLLSDTAGNQPQKSSLVDTTVKNRYGDLLNDDKKYNLKYPLWKPAVQVVGVNVALNLLDRYALNLKFVRVDSHSWTRNLHAGFPWGPGWEWDEDRFGNNFLLHPITGSFYFNAARANGYNFWESAPFVFAGSYMWKIFGENGKPEREDLINTTFHGILLGEISYRLSSNILDDRTYGSERALREVIAGIIDPMRGFNRLLQGKTFRHTTTEVYQKEPLNITLSAGVHKINSDSRTVFGRGPTNPLINVQLDYGNPFEDIRRKPFDLFRFRTEFSFGVGRKIVDNIIGYGVLFGNNAQIGKLSILYGAFQYYDYWDNKTFELGSVGFGGGVITKFPFSKFVNLYTNFHIAAIPLAGNSTRYGPDSSQVRDYTYNDGLQAKLESTLAFGKVASIAVVYDYYLLHTFNGPAGNNYVGVLRPRLNVQLYKNLSIGFEHFAYYDDRYLKNFPAIFSLRTEQKIYLTYFFEDPQRRGRYN